MCRWARWALNGLRRQLDRHCARRQQIAHDSIQSFQACQVLLHACRARNRALNEERERAAKGENAALTSDSITAIVLAAAATEAFINEFAELIGLYRQNARDWAELTRETIAAADAIFEVEFLKGSIDEKYMAASKALGHRFDRGAAPFQAFEQLVNLRNAIMHIKSTRAGERHSGQRITADLVQRGIAFDRPGLQTLPWFDKLQSPPAAVWACESALAIILAIEGMVPTGPAAIAQGERSLFRRHQGLRTTDWL